MAATRRAAPRRSPPKPQLIGDDFEFEPLQLSSKEVPETTRMPLFYLDDIEYRIDVPFRVNLSLQYLRMAREQGENIATGWLMEQVLGQDGYTALMEYEGLQAKHLRRIGAVVSNLALGAVEDPKGSSANGSHR